MSVRAPFITIYWGEMEITSDISYLRYTYSEEDDDICEMDVELTDRDAADRPEFQERTIWTVMWGYIQEPDQTVIRKVSLENIRWEYGKTTIKARIEATDLASSRLRRAVDNRVHKNTNLLDLALKYAEENNLKLYFDKNHQPIVDKLEMNTKTGKLHFVFRGERLSAKPIESNFRELHFGIDAQYTALIKKFESGTYPVLRTEDDIRDQKKYNDLKAYNFEKYKELQAALNLKPIFSLPMANRSAKQVIDGVALEEPGGPFVAETRDDGVTIHTRNFSQDPYKAYEYGGDVGDLIDFNPEGKLSGKSGHSHKLGFGGWNTEDKNYFNGSTDAENSNDPILNSFIEVSPDGRDDRVNVHFTSQARQSTWETSKPADATNVVKLQSLSVDNHTDSQPLNKVKEKLRTLFNPAGEDALASYGLASNIRGRGELQRNPATTTMVGDVNLKCGMIVTILQASKKHSGNYYITECTHEIDRSGYLVRNKMVRQGHNVKSQDTYKTAKELNRPKNDKVGDLAGSKENQPLTVKSNK